MLQDSILDWFFLFWLNGRLATLGRLIDRLVPTKNL